jgi:hypothetical protein
MDRHSVAQKQFITVAGSAVFGTFVSMLLAFVASSHLTTTVGSKVEPDTAAREQVILGCRRRNCRVEGSVGQSRAGPQPPEIMAAPPARACAPDAGSAR